MSMSVPFKLCELCGGKYERLRTRMSDKEWDERRYCSKRCANRVNGNARIQSISERFWRYVRKGAPNECWIWTGGTDGRGYGAFGLTGRDGKKTKAHRVSYELATGQDPGHLHVCHRCDNPPCVNPDHLFLGTAKDNIADMIAKGRKVVGDSSGEKNPAAKFNWPMVRLIRLAHECGASRRAIANAAQCDPSNIGLIVTEQNWKERS